MLTRLMCEIKQSDINIPTICHLTVVGAPGDFTSAESVRRSKAGFIAKTLKVGRVGVKPRCALRKDSFSLHFSKCQHSNKSWHAERKFSGWPSNTKRRTFASLGQLLVAKRLKKATSIF